MSKSLIDDLEKAGYKAQRLGPDDPAPSVGGLVTGIFTEVDEGNACIVLSSISVPAAPRWTFT